MTKLSASLAHIFLVFLALEFSASQQSSNVSDPDRRSTAVYLNVLQSVTHSHSKQALNPSGEMTTSGQLGNQSWTPPAVGPSISSHCSTLHRFHTGSFLGGVMLTFVCVLVISLGYRSACSNSKIRYSAIEEHVAVI